jgi:ABC-type Mn2+/Zn2+ transport system permease subunit
MSLVLLDNLGSYGFAQVAAASTLLVSLMCGLLSPAIVLKQRSYLGDTLAHLVFPGVIVGYFASTGLGLPLWASLVVGAAVSGFLGNVLLGFLERRLRIPPDAAAVVTLTAFFAAGVVAVSKVSGTRVDLHNILFGDVLTLEWGDVLTLGVVNVFALGALGFFRADWDAWGSDPEFAAIAGFKVVAVERLFPILTTFVVLSGMFAVGGLMISALLAIPAILSSPRSFLSPKTVVVSVAMGLVGLTLAFEFDWPVGSTIVLVGAVAVVAKAILPRSVARLD